MVVALLWVVIGLAAGWAIGMLMLGKESRGARELAAAVAGAFLGPLLLQLYDPAAKPDTLTAALAALAGALWLAWIACVLTSGDVAATSLDEETDMMSYGAARNSIVTELLKDAAAHEAGHFDTIGRRFDAIERELPRGEAPALARLRVALAFWDGWIDARNNAWQGGGDIQKGEWPMLARRVASDLAADLEISEPRVGARFDTAGNGSRAGRVEVLSARLRAE
jgi:uncharacterized membrane protein YeaQ/YmgE (transglycosylase-associated protein family)